MTEEDDHYVASALYDFQSDSPRELPFKAGDKIIIAPKGMSKSLLSTR